MSKQTEDLIYRPSANEIPKWGQPYPNILNRESVHSALSDYILQVNYQGYKPDPRKVLAVRTSGRTASLRNASTPIRQEVVFGRIGSVITSLKLTPTERPYTEVYGYCLYAFDGACIDRCPSKAITDAGKLPGMCTKHGNSQHFKAWGYGSCGHCSTFVPCSRGIPAKIKKTL